MRFGREGQRNLLEEEMNKDAFTALQTTGKAKERSFADELLCTALDVAEGLLKCGAEVHRAEDTVERICRAYSAAHVEVFAITSLIIASVRMQDGTYSSQLRRIYTTSNHFKRLEALNELSRTICRETPPIDEVQVRLREIKTMRTQPRWLTYVATVLAAGGFAIFFGGGILDGVAAAVIGILITLLEELAPKRTTVLARTLLSSFVAGILAELLRFTGYPFNVDKIMIGVIMLLIPGVAFSNSFRDLLSGDLLAGSLRLIQSILLAGVIALGFSAAILLMGGVG